MCVCTCVCVCACVHACVLCVCVCMCACVRVCVLCVCVCVVGEWQGKGGCMQAYAYAYARTGVAGLQEVAIGDS